MGVDCGAYRDFTLDKFLTCTDPSHTDFCMFYDEDVDHVGCLDSATVVEKCASKKCGLGEGCLP